jgi:hypothetical protein
VSKYKVTTASPLLRQLFTGRSWKWENEVCARAGIANGRVTSRWRTGRNSPQLASIEAFAEAAGYRLVLVKDGGELPDTREWLNIRPADFAFKSNLCDTHK